MKLKKIKRLAIANRGEVAVRIIRACEEMGIETVLLHSEVDVNTRAYRLADKTICIGPALTMESYLNIEANIQGALAAGADSIHPGFGFLSENPEFAQKCLDAGIIFVGPPPSAMKMLGDKMACKTLAMKLGLPLVPGYQGENQDTDYLIQEAKRIGFPVIIKAAAGGGGRGMKILKDESTARDLIDSAKRESLSAFGSAQVFLEKYLDRAKHIEFQIFADASGRVVSLLDRECSVQRRHQKIVEESLSANLNSEVRRKMSEAAVLITSEAKYRGAGTVEFMLQDDQFYLLEVNTRLQVEHPVTEMVMGVDLVKAQILTAQGDSVFPDSQLIAPRGHSIECRIYAENPYMNGVPSTGILGRISWPEGPGRRFEYGFEEGDEITSYYDSMIAKVVVWDETRPRAILKMLQVLKDSIIFGVHTNIPYLKEILSHPEFVQGTMTTRFIETYFPEGLKPQPLSFEARVYAEKSSRQFSSNQSAAHSVNSPNNSISSTSSPWQEFWRGV